MSHREVSIADKPEGDKFVVSVARIITEEEYLAKKFTIVKQLGYFLST